MCETDSRWFGLRWRNHQIQAAFYNFVPFSIFKYIYKKLVAPQLFKEREEGE